MVTGRANPNAGFFILLQVILTLKYFFVSSSVSRVQVCPQPSALQASLGRARSKSAPACCRLAPAQTSGPIQSGLADHCCGAPVLGRTRPGGLP